MLNEPDAGHAGGHPPVGGAPLAHQEGQEGNQASGNAPQPGYITVTADEQAAINRVSYSRCTFHREIKID